MTYKRIHRDRLRDPLRIPSLLQPADELLGQGRHEEAMALVRDFLATNPNQPAALFLECKIMVQDHGAQQADSIYRDLAKLVNPHASFPMRQLRREIRDARTQIHAPQFTPNPEQGEIAFDFSQPPSNDF